MSATSTWDIEARSLSSGVRLIYRVASQGELKTTHERLIKDDPVWMGARIRSTPSWQAAHDAMVKSFWDRLQVLPARS